MSDANTTPHVLITGAAGALGRAVAHTSSTRRQPMITMYRSNT